MEEPETDGEVRFAGCAINRKTRRVTIDGAPVVLHAKALSLLLYLIDQRHRAVPRCELLAAIWPGVIVAENNVSVQLSKVRQMLRLLPGGEALVVTLETPGEPHYRFVGELEAAPPGVALAAPKPPPVPAKRRRLPVFLPLAALVLAGAAALAWREMRPGIAPRPALSFAVLPFRNLSGDRSQDWLSERVTDDLVAAIGRMPHGTVLSRQSAGAVQTRTPQEIGRTLHVRYLVRGTVSPEGAGFHVYAELVDTGSGATLAAWSFDPQRGDSAAVRTQILGYLTRELNLTMDRLAAQPTAGATTKPDAASLLYRARFTLDHAGTLQAYVEAQALLERAIAQDPDYPPALAELGWTLLAKVSNTDDPDDQRDYANARRRIAEALRLDPDNGTALAAYARELMLDGDCTGAVPNATRVTLFDPGNLRARSVLASCAQIDMRFADAVSEYEDMLRLDPDGSASRSRHLAIGTILLMQGDAERAAPHLEQCRDAVAPSGDMGAAEQCQLLAIAARGMLGQRDDAAALYRGYAQQVAGRSIWRLGAYYAPKWHALAGYRRLEEALHQAGMPYYAGETDMASPDGVCGAGDFAATPLHLPGGIVLDTAGFLGLKPDTLIIDVGRHRVDLPHAVYYATAAMEGETEAHFAARMAQQHKAASSIAVAGDGVAGCAAYRAAAALIAGGLHHVAWYRGGEEAWARHLAAAGTP